VLIMANLFYKCVELSLWCVFSVALLSFIYLVMLAVNGVKVQRRKGYQDQPHFSILISVYNEELTLPSLLDSLENLDYPKSLISVLFVADHCTDNTVLVIKKSGFRVIERTGGELGKAVSIKYGINKIMDGMKGDGGYLAIFDADNVIDSDFLNSIVRALSKNIMVYQGNTTIENKYQSIFTRLNYINYCATNRFKELARSQAGLSCRLRGQGMVFNKSIIDQFSWDASTLVEDQEMLIDLVLKDYRVSWVYDAHVGSVIPSSISDSFVQRKRWSGGKNEIALSAIIRLLKKSIKDFDIVALDLMIDFLLPSYSVLICMIMLGTALSAIFLETTSFLVFGFIGLLVAFFTYYLLAARLESIPLKILFSIVFSPAYIVWRGWVFLLSLRGAKYWR